MTIKHRYDRPALAGYQIHNLIANPIHYPLDLHIYKDVSFDTAQQISALTFAIWIVHSCTPDRNCHTFCLGDKIASHPGVLTQSKKKYAKP